MGISDDGARIGIMGGTFDPIHYGHLLAAERAREALDLEEVWFLPSYSPPHKRNLHAADSKDRLAMVKLATSPYRGFVTKDDELRRGGTSYTVDTVRQYLDQYPKVHFYFIIGADMVEYLPKWHQIDQLLEWITFIGVARPGYVIDHALLESAMRGKVLIVEMPAMDISSSAIRERRNQGQSIRFLLPDSVYAYIKEHGLYV